ncbi:unnamed protein product [Didymodactylos carnosus]|uniref:Uncharacterized protein n=1 Tax=Didymodactylos carnosus TaxID=1234261 RepID=A0A813Y4M8_9BILA|nr:unnamed protein product [Didymodactylos carnosus]CAF1013727.1 unnamed protein product [Didymodactylos carnosus]CAF3666478.1 unnamed protein product [Didymodactylos carnosus]CAF3782743.1 unnamed protein product [Didymodactylos carnosus]
MSTMMWLARSLFLFYLLPAISAVSFTEEDPHLKIKLMDIKLSEWKPSYADRLEQALDSELAYINDKKGVDCKAIDLSSSDFEEKHEAAVQDGRFLTISLLGKCTEPSGKVHPVEKAIMIEAIIRHTDAIRQITGATLIKIDDIQIYKRDRNFLNLIIIPSACGFILLLGILTFGLRFIRERQKRRHIVSELKKRGPSKARAANKNEPNSDEKQSLLPREPIAGKESDKIGSSKQITHERDDSRAGRSSRPDTSANNRRPIQDPPHISNVSNDPTAGGNYRPDFDERMSRPNRDERVPYRDTMDGRSSRQDPQFIRSSQERIQTPYDNRTRRFSPNRDELHMTERDHMHRSMPPPSYLDANPPRVVVRSVPADADFVPYYRQQQYHQHPDESMFIPIPVQIERGGVHARFPTYDNRMQPSGSPHYDRQQTQPYYRHINT